MGIRRNQFGSRGPPDDSDLELLRERILDHPEDEDAVSGHDIDANSQATTGPIKVIVRQDGIGRTGAAVLAALAGLALGISGTALTLMLLRDGGLNRELDKTQTEYRVLLNHVMELEAAQKAMERSK